MVDIYKIIACPICKGKLEKKENNVICKFHGEFPISKTGVPILFKENNIYHIGEKGYKNGKKNKRVIFINKKIFKKPKLNWGKSLHDKLKIKYIDRAPENKIILNIGSGQEKKFDQSNFVNFDIYPHWNTHVAGDAHYLPFLDNSVDIIWICAVMELLEKPFVILDEVYRVLKHWGLILISVPFIQYMQTSFHDYFGFSKYGLRSLCEKFTEIESGPSYTAPMGTLIQLSSVFPEVIFNNKILKNGLSFIIAWLLSPLLLFDLIFKNNNKRDSFRWGLLFRQKINFLNSILLIKC